MSNSNSTALFGEPPDDPHGSPFDKIRQVDEMGEFWTGRRMQPLMDYARWDKFAEVIEKAKFSLGLIKGEDAAAHHFATWGSDGGRWGNSQLDDYRLTRFGAYLVAMAGDDTKEAVAEARIYFAVATRAAEVAASRELAAPGVLALPNLRGMDEQSILFVQQLSQSLTAYTGALIEEKRKTAALLPAAELAATYAAANGVTAMRSFARDVQQWAKDRGVRVLQQHVFDYLGHIGVIIRARTSEHGQATAFAIAAGHAENETVLIKHRRGVVEKRKYGKLTASGEDHAFKRIRAAIAEHGTLDLKVINADT